MDGLPTADLFLFRHPEPLEPSGESSEAELEQARLGEGVLKGHICRTPIPYASSRTEPEKVELGWVPCSGLRHRT